MPHKTTGPALPGQPLAIAPPYVIDRMSQKTPTGLSASLQAGKAAEHIACAELILQGWNAFVVDAGLPYDVLVDLSGGRFSRIQVKATCQTTRPRNYPGRSPAFRRCRFALRRSRCGVRRISLESCDQVAFVALDIRAVAFLTVAAVTTSKGRVPEGVEFKSRSFVYSRGKAGPDPYLHGRFIEDFSVFDPSS
jgi:hypothetical protein